MNSRRVAETPQHCRHHTSPGKETRSRWSNAPDEPVTRLLIGRCQTALCDRRARAGCCVADNVRCDSSGRCTKTREQHRRGGNSVPPGRGGFPGQITTTRPVTHLPGVSQWKMSSQFSQYRGLKKRQCRTGAVTTNTQRRGCVEDQSKPSRQSSGPKNSRAGSTPLAGGQVKL
ncbi:unnamed protein product [Pleuronectes platessa]|uniref:Uncharacterized protein n=1 Tax=Pleuronectes platessa TaxID=8262 RepID=A0A9N7V653_PLEPL|nr:unnamed protein product [Pleuronectes platessa]